MTFHAYLRDKNKTFVGIKTRINEFFEDKLITRRERNIALDKVNRLIGLFGNLSDPLETNIHGKPRLYIRPNIYYIGRRGDSRFSAIKVTVLKEGNEYWRDHNIEKVIVIIPLCYFKDSLQYTYYKENIPSCTGTAYTDKNLVEVISKLLA